MLFRFFVSGLLGLTVLLGSVSEPVNAQRAPEAFIDIFGGIIEEGMRQQQQEELRRRERERLEEQRRFQREAEIAWTRRVQTALWHLGFYEARVDGDWGPITRAAASAFNGAFDLPDGDYGPEWVDFLEEMAERGYRSAEELKAAKAGGFTDRDALFHARERGFSSAQRLAEAEAEGFRTKDEYEAFLDSGLPDRDAFLAHREEQARLAELVAGCRESKKRKDWITASKACHAAMSEGAEEPDLEDTYQAVHEKISRILSGIEEDPEHGLGHVPRLVVEQGSRTDDSEDGLRDGPAHRRADLLHADAVFRCWRGYREERWDDVIAACREAASEGAEDQDVFLERISAAEERIEQERRREREEARLRAERAEAERRRLALEQARESATSLLTDLQGYSDSGASFDNGVEIARAAVGLRETLEGDSAEAIEESRLRLEGLLEGEANYRTFLDERRRANEIAEANALVLARRNVVRLGEFVKAYLADNVLAPEVPDLLEIQDALSDISDSSRTDDVLLAYRDAMDAIGALGLEDEAEAHLQTLAEEAEHHGSVEKSEIGFIVTDGNRDLLTGADRDVLVLANLSGTAPHLVRNLAGELVFEGRTARSCWFHKAPEPSLRHRLALAEVRNAGAERIDDSGRCTPKGIDEHDVILVERGAFMTTDPAYARHLVERYETDAIRLLGMIAWEGLAEREAGQAELARTIREEVSAGLREGFGLIRPSGGGDALCLVGGEEGALHRTIVDRSGDELDLLVGTGLSVRETTLGTVFIDVQRNDCGAVYLSGADMRELVTALDREGLGYEVMPWWKPMEDVEALREARSRQETVRERALAERRQEREGQERLERERRAAEEAAVKELREELREEHGQAARGALNRVRQVVTEHLEASLPDKNQPTIADDLFPRFAERMRDSGEEFWEFTSHDVDMADYGTALWRDRRLEAVLARVEIRSRNRPLGEYRSDCFVLGFLVDAEFETLRDPIAVECQQEDEAVGSWQEGREFVSRWWAGSVE